VCFIVPRVIIVLDESKVFFLLSLESGWSSVNIGRKVTLGKKGGHKHTWGHGSFTGLHQKYEAHRLTSQVDMVL
jgi:hypothetical protein